VWRKALIAIGLACAAASSARGQTSAMDPEVAKGVWQVEEGDYDAAILTLDTAARRLSTDGKRSRELSQAYLYLGVAYVGKGHEAAAKAKFREAVHQLRDLTLSPDKFPPKVIDLFEAAREEATRAPASAAADGKKGGGGKKVLIIGGLAAAAAGGAIVLAGGSGDGQKVETFTFAVSEDQHGVDYRIVVVASGTLEAHVTWTSTGGSQAGVLELELSDADGVLVARSNLTANTTALLTSTVAPLPGGPSQEYKLHVHHRESCGGCTVSGTLEVRHP
jgi:hypothetical protein